MSEEAARAQFWILDAGGLITTARGGLSDVVKPFARPQSQEDVDGEKLLEVIKRVGVSGRLTCAMND